MPGTLSVPLRSAEFLPAAVDLRFQFHARAGFSHIKRPDAFRTVDFMGGEAHQIDLQLLDIDGDFADRLRGVAMQQHAALFAQAADLGKRLDRADFVVGQHDGNENRVGPNCLGDLLGIDAARPFVAGGNHRQQRDLETAAAEFFERFEHRGMFGRHADDVPAFLGQAARPRRESPGCCSRSRRW